MKLLLDNNLSPKLVRKLADSFPNSSHVSQLGLEAASDLEVWNVARREGYCLVTKDADFNELLIAKGFPPKVIWIRLGNCTTNEILGLLEKHIETIHNFEKEESAGLLELQ
jgi:predicted nuclease of predicted toxin-antitoxin system